MALLSHMLRGNVKCKKCFQSSNIRLLSSLWGGIATDVPIQRFNRQITFLEKSTPPLCSVGLSATRTKTNPNRVTFAIHHYFSSQTKTPVTGLTDEILKGRIKEASESSTSTTDHTQSDQGGQSDDTKEKSESHSWFSPKNAWKLGLISLGVTIVLSSGYLFLVWGAPLKDPGGNEIRDQFSDLPKWEAYSKRFLKETVYMKKMIIEPSSKKLLPDPLKEPYFQPPYTLVLEMTGVLIHPDWTLGTGWRFKKRPHIDYLLQTAGPPLFEVVIYTKEQGMTAFPIVDGIDPNGFVSYRLFRDATLYKNGEHCKDLSCLNRDISKIIVVDCNPQAVQLQPRNAVTMKKWKGEDGDKNLIDLANFLRTIAISGVEDVRTVLDHYNQFDDPIEAFKQRQAELQAQMESTKNTDQGNKGNLVSTWSKGFGRRRGN